MRNRERNTSTDGWKPPYYGAIPRVEAQAAHETFIEAAHPQCVLLSVTHARRLAKRGLTATEWAPPGTTVMTTTTINDEALARLSRDREAEIVEAFRPAYHIPADHPVYADDPVEQQREQARKCARGTRELAERVPDKTQIVPLIKGSTPEIRAETIQAAGAVDPEVVAYYGAQYFTTAGGGGWPALRQDLAGIKRETDGYPVVVIGLLSAALLAEAPSNVIGGAGLRKWREAARPRTTDTRGIQRAYGGLAAAVEDAVGPGEGSGGTTVRADGGCAATGPRKLSRRRMPWQRPLPAMSVAVNGHPGEHIRLPKTNGLHAVEGLGASRASEPPEATEDMDVDEQRREQGGDYQRREDRRQ